MAASPPLRDHVSCTIPTAYLSWGVSGESQLPWWATPVYLQQPSLPHTPEKGLGNQNWFRPCLSRRPAGLAGALPLPLPEPQLGPAHGSETRVQQQIWPAPRRQHKPSGGQGAGSRASMVAGAAIRYLGSTCSPSRYSGGYMALRGCPGSAMPSGGDTGSMPSSLLARADVLLGSGDLSGERVPVWSELGAPSRGGHIPRSTPAQAGLTLHQGSARFSWEGPGRNCLVLWATVVCATRSSF